MAASIADLAIRGVGYAGGVWRGGVFSYNRTVNNFGSVNITNTYNKTVINNTSVTNVSFNGGTSARATPQQLAAANEQHTPPTAAQTQHPNLASANPALHNCKQRWPPADRGDIAFRSVQRRGGRGRQDRRHRSCGSQSGGRRNGQ
jgi:hypothetical protein